MPLASSTDLILAGIADIVNALNNPSPGSALALLSNSNVHALRQLTSVLTNIAAPDSLPSPVPTPSGAAPLRVLESQPLPTPPLRRSALRVPRTETSQRTVRFQPLPPPHVSTTYANATGPTGTKRRRAKRSHNPPLPNKTLHPLCLRQLRKINNKRTPSKSPNRKGTLRRQPTHSHGTHANTTTPLSHVAAAAQDLLSPTNPESDNFIHTALHGNAFNPDTGRLANFLELSKCKEGAL